MFVALLQFLHLAPLCALSRRHLNVARLGLVFFHYPSTNCPFWSTDTLQMRNIKTTNFGSRKTKHSEILRRARWDVLWGGQTSSWVARGDLSTDDFKRRPGRNGHNGRVAKTTPDLDTGKRLIEHTKSGILGCSRILLSKYFGTNNNEEK